MDLVPVTYQPIGVIRSPFSDLVGMPVQGAGAAGVAGRIELVPEYAAGLRDIAGFSHLFLIYHLHLVRGAALEVTPFLDDRPHGLSVVRLTGVGVDWLDIADVDVVDGTPLLDIKPYVPAFDSHATDRIGWFAKNVGRVGEIKADDRFA